MPIDDVPDCSAGQHPPRANYTAPAPHVLTSAAKMLSAAGDPARLNLLLRLAEGPLCVSEIAEVQNEKVVTVSARLKLLYDARLVIRERRAKHVFYALADDHIAGLLKDTLDHAAETNEFDQ